MFSTTAVGYRRRGSWLDLASLQGVAVTVSQLTAASLVVLVSKFVGIHQFPRTIVVELNLVAGTADLSLGLLKEATEHTIYE